VRLNQSRQSTIILNQFQQSLRDVDRAKLRVARAGNPVGPAAQRAQIALQTAQLRADTLGQQYRFNLADQPAPNLVQTLAPAAKATSDFGDRLQELLLIAGRGRRGRGYRARADPVQPAAAAPLAGMTASRRLPAAAVAAVGLLAALVVAYGAVATADHAQGFKEACAIVAAAGLVIVCAVARPAWTISLGLGLSVFNSYWPDMGIPFSVDRLLLAVGGAYRAVPRGPRARLGPPAH